MGDAGSDHDERTVHPAVWVPCSLADYLQRMAGKLPLELKPLALKLCTDERMESVWKWLDVTHPDAREPKGPVARYVFDSLAVFMAIADSIGLPAKPGDLPPGEREKYFERVRKHAIALIELLEKTRFDCAWDEGSLIGEDLLKEPLSKHAYSWGIEEPFEGHIFAVRVDREGVWSVPYDYPDNTLSNMLHDLIGWTYYDDCWGRDLFKSSQPVKSQRGWRSEVHFFNCTLWEKLASHGVHIPMAHLATIANVVFELDVAKQLDESGVRKQVDRYKSENPVKEIRVRTEEFPF